MVPGVGAAVRGGTTSLSGVFGNLEAGVVRRDKPGSDLGARPESEAVADPLDVAFRRAFRDGQPRGDLAVGQPAGDELGDLLLANGEVRTRRPAGRPKPEETPDGPEDGVRVPEVRDVRPPGEPHESCTGDRARQQLAL